MRKTTKERLAKADKKMLNIVRDHLDYHMIRVRKWLPYNGRRTSRDVVYEAFIDHSRVNIPVQRKSKTVLNAMCSSIWYRIVL